MLPRCTRLDFKAVAALEEWRAPLQQWFVYACEKVIENKGCLGEKGRVKRSGVWDEQVAFPLRNSWPKWTMNLGDVPIICPKYT